jgi:hypothetical protein
MYFVIIPQLLLAILFLPYYQAVFESMVIVGRKPINIYTVNGHGLRFFESPYPNPLPQREAEKSRNPCPC